VHRHNKFKISAQKWHLPLSPRARRASSKIIREVVVVVILDAQVVKVVLFLLLLVVKEEFCFSAFVLRNGHRETMMI
tara:strand:+ start:1334 stop:1564 length:231 start_codon:yes stop_codon:yes gene_type:complete